MSRFWKIQRMVWRAIGVDEHGHCSREFGCNLCTPFLCHFPCSPGKYNGGALRLAIADV